MQEQIDRDIKDALLSGDKTTAEILRTLKSSLQNEAIAKGARDSGLNDEQVQQVLVREAKKRAEAAEMYKKGGAEDKAQAELSEKAIIESYLPPQVSEAEITQAVEEEIKKLGATGMADMGKVIGAVRGRLGAGADGALIAGVAKEKLS